MAKRRKIWVHELYQGASDVYVTREEPEWVEVWGDYGWLGGSWRTMCKFQFEKAFGVRVPQWPKLLEIEFEVKDTKIWEPIKKGSES